MNLEMKTANYIDLGMTDYFETFKLQEELAEKRLRDEIPDTILISEHYPLVNFGMREESNKFSDNFIKEMNSAGIEFTEENAIKYLKERDINFYRTSRGGGATFIGPGQINFYPIVKYERISKEIFGAGGYLKRINSIMQEGLNSYGLDAKKRSSNKKDGKDVWIERNGSPFKLGGKGIKLSKGIAYHGFNFYLKEKSTSGFKYVNPCGYSQKYLKVTNVEKALNKKIEAAHFKQNILNKIKEKFEYDSIEEIDKQELIK